MRGYTKEQLDAKHANLPNYAFCELYWHKRIFEKHLRPPTKTRRIEIMSPAFEEFIEFLAEAAVKQWQAEVANGTYKPEPTKNAKAARVKTSNPKRAPSDHGEPFTVDERLCTIRLSTVRLPPAAVKKFFHLFARVQPSFCCLAASL